MSVFGGLVPSLIAPRARQPRCNDFRQAHASRSRSRHGMTIVEILAVIGVIGVLLAILVPAVSLARRNALWGSSQANLRQVGQLLILYAGDNRDAVVPTAFDYRGLINPGKPRSGSPTGATAPIGPLNYGTWTDILWTTGKFGPIASNADAPVNAWDYRFDSPDAALYATGWDGTNPFRSTEVLFKPVVGTGPTPYGTGPSEEEKNDPGYFAGNPFFDARPATASTPYAGKYWSLGQIKRPEVSMYCADSAIGEIFELNDTNVSPSNGTLDLVGAEWRYSGDNVLMLMLDGHVDTIGKWDSLYDLEKNLGVRVLGLDQNRFFTN